MKKFLKSLILGITIFVTGCSSVGETTNISNVTSSVKDGKYAVSQEEKEYLKKRFDEFESINRESVGYINIPGTKVTEPIVQTTDNSKYLEVSFEGVQSPMGAIFMDKDNDSKFNDKLTWLFGHVLGSKFPNNRMFKDVMNYRDQKYFDEHKYVVIETPERKYYYEAQVFMVVPETTEYYRINFESNEEFQKQLTEIKNLNSLKKEEKILTQNEELLLDAKYNYLVLSTCLDFGDPEELRYNLYLRQIPDSELNDFLEKNKDKFEVSTD